MTGLFFNLLPFFVQAQVPTDLTPFSDTVTVPPTDLSNQGNNNLPATPPAPTKSQGILVLPDPLNLNADISKAPGQLVTRITNIFLGLVGIGALVVIIYGGSLYLFSMGDNKKADKGRKVLEYAIIGLAIILGAYIIINTALSVLTQVTK